MKPAVIRSGNEGDGERIFPVQKEEDPDISV